MGMYDIVLVPCPMCGKEEEFQSKGGNCFLEVFKLADCPEDVLEDVNRHGPSTCEDCGTNFQVGITTKFVKVGVPILI